MESCSQVDVAFLILEPSSAPALERPLRMRLDLFLLGFDTVVLLDRKADSSLEIEVMR